MYLDHCNAPVLDLAISVCDSVNEISYLRAPYSLFNFFFLFLKYSNLEYKSQVQRSLFSNDCCWLLCILHEFDDMMHPKSVHRTPELLNICILWTIQDDKAYTEIEQQLFYVIFVHYSEFVAIAQKTIGNKKRHYSDMIWLVEPINKSLCPSIMADMN